MRVAEGLEHPAACVVLYFCFICCLSLDVLLDKISMMAASSVPKVQEKKQNHGEQETSWKFILVQLEKPG